VTPAGRAISPPDPADETDGRRRRSHDSRARIVAAMLTLIREGETSPGAEQVAACAQVGLRTVFRHFRDMDSLYREISQAIEAELRAVVAQPFNAADWRGRVLELVARRGPPFERIAPFRRAADVHRRRSALLAGDHDRLSKALREILRGLIPADAGVDPVDFEILDLLLSFESWSRLRHDQQLSIDQTREVLEAAVRHTLARSTTA